MKKFSNFFLLFVGLLVISCQNNNENTKEFRTSKFKISATLKQLKIDNDETADRVGKIYAKAEINKKIDDSEMLFLMNYVKNANVNKDNDRVRIGVVSTIINSLDSVPAKFNTDISHIISKRLQIREATFDAVTLKMCIKIADKSQINIAKSLLDDKRDFVQESAINYLKFIK